VNQLILYNLFCEAFHVTSPVMRVSKNSVVRFPIKSGKQAARLEKD